MKTDVGNNVRLGLFITVGTILFITGIYFIGSKQQLFNRTFRISCVFKDVYGLQAGNNVRFSGIKVGTIEDIQIISDTSVKVDMIIEEDVRKFIRKDANAIIGSEGLMGNKILVISPGTSGQTVIEEDDFIRTIPPVDIDNVMKQLKTTSENAAQITGDIAGIVKNIKAGKGAVGKLFMDTVLGENLNQSILNIKEGSDGFKQNMDAAKNSFLLKGFIKKRVKKKK